MKKIILLHVFTIISVWLMASVTVNVSSTNVDCFGNYTGTASAAATGGTAPYTYAWSNGYTTTTISSLYAGVYNVTVQDASSATVTGSVTVNQPAALVVQLSTTNISCYGLANGQIQATATGGSVPYTYSWSNGNNSNPVVNLYPGLYSVTVSDGHACTATASASITSPTAIVSSVSVINPQCYGDLTGSIRLTDTGGTNIFRYQWSNGATSQNLTGASIGSYSVTISDANGCTLTESASIIAPQQLIATFTMVADTAQAHHWFLVYNAQNFTPSQYQWSWGDGTSSTGPNPSHTYADSGYYNICMLLTTDSGCTASYCDSSTFLRGQQQLIISVDAIAQTTGINDISNTAITSVYPNPAVTTLHITTSMQGIINYQLYNTVGQLISEKQSAFKDVDVDIQNLNAGIYFIKLKNGQTEGLVRFVKE